MNSDRRLVSSASELQAAAGDAGVFALARAAIVTRLRAAATRTSPRLRTAEASTA